MTRGKIERCLEHVVAIEKKYSCGEHWKRVKRYVGDHILD
ncbi:unnamed protein product [Arabidopsis halleri]